MKVTIDLEDVKGFCHSKGSIPDEWYGPEDQLTASVFLEFFEWANKKQAILEFKEFYESLNE